MSETATKKQKLSIYLLEKGTTPEGATKEQEEIKDYEHIEGSKYIAKDNKPIEPIWVKYLRLEKLKTSSPSAVLFVPHSELWFAICFGHGHNMLNKDKMVDDFGLISALNILDKDQVKSSDIFAPSDHSKQRRIQTTKPSNLIGHNIDKFFDILRGITGKSKAKYKILSKSISATFDSLKINTDTEAKDLPKLCSKIFDIYKKKDYKKDFPDAFYIRPVNNEGTSNSLNKKLLSSLNNRMDNVYLEIPDLVDFQEIDKFRLNLKDRKKHIISDLEINELYALVNGRDISIENLSNWGVELLDQNGNKRTSFNLRKCFVLDCILNDENGKKEYHFSHGKWYFLAPDLSKNLENICSYQRQKINNQTIPKYHHDRESSYNKHLAKELGATLLDNKLIQMEGYDKIELCDILCISSENENIFIHVKRKHGSSSGLSHLFSQADISLTLLNQEDTKFIEGIKKEVKTFRPSLNKVIHFLIIGQANRALPLFTRINLHRRIMDIHAKGAKVYWSVIDQAVPNKTLKNKSTNCKTAKRQP